MKLYTNKVFFILMALSCSLAMVVQPAFAQENFECDIDLSQVSVQQTFDGQNRLLDRKYYSLSTAKLVCHEVYRISGGASHIDKIFHYEYEAPFNHIIKDERFKVKNGNDLRVLTKEWKVFGSNARMESHYDYDSNGRIDSLKIYNPDANKILYLVDYDSPSGRIIKLKRYVNGSLKTVTNYNSDGLISSYKKPNGANLAYHNANLAGPQKYPAGRMKNNEINADVAINDYELMFFGDSIMSFWSSIPQNEVIWDTFWGEYDAINAGISGDETGPLAFRLQENVQGEDPKLVVLNIGINNIQVAEDTVEHIAEGIFYDIARIHANVPNAQILLIGIIPAIGVQPSHPIRVSVDETNELIMFFEKIPQVTYVDIGSEFLNPDNTLNESLFDFFKLHPNVAGYTVYGNAIDDVVAELMSE